MGDYLRKAIESRRRKLIDKLIAFNVYKKDDKHLFELTLTELEKEYKKYFSQSHPHCDIGSIRWGYRKS